MIKNFTCKDTESLFRTRVSRKLPHDIQDLAYRKLAMLHVANSMIELKYPPSNRFKKLKGKWNLKYSIRVNRKYRITFVWSQGHAYHVSIEDYH